MSMTVYRVIGRSSNTVEVFYDVADCVAAMLGRRREKYIILKSEEDYDITRDVLVNMTSNDVRYLELQLNIL